MNPITPRILSPTARHPHTYTTHTVNPPGGSWEPPLLGAGIGAHSKEQGNIQGSNSPHKNRLLRLQAQVESSSSTLQPRCTDPLGKLKGVVSTG